MHLLQKLVSLHVHCEPVTDSWGQYTCSNACDQASLIQQCLDSGQYLCIIFMTIRFYRNRMYTVSQSCQVEHVEFLESWSSRLVIIIITLWCHWAVLVIQVAPSSGLTIGCLCKCNPDAIVIVAPPGADFRSLWSPSLEFTPNTSRIHMKRFFCWKIKDQSNSLNSVRFCNISVRPGDHAPLLETHGSSVRLGRSV